MEFKADINYEELPHAIIKFIDTEKDVYPHLPPNTQKRINRNYNLSLEIPVSQKTLKTIFPEQWNLLKRSEKIAGKLPPHIINFDDGRCASK